MKFSTRSLILGVSLLTPIYASLPPALAQDGTLSGLHYSVRIGGDGMVSSLQVERKELLEEPILYGNRAWLSLKPGGWTVLKRERLSETMLRYTLAAAEFEGGGKPVVEFTYEAKPDVFLMTLKRLSNAWGGCIGWNTASTVTRVTLPGTSPPGYRRLPGRGITYGLPYPGGIQPVRQMVYSLDDTDARKLAIEYKLGDADLVRQAEGTLTRNGWGRELINSQPLEFSFRPLVTEGKAGAAAEIKGAPAFALSLEKRGQMFFPGEKIPIRLRRNGALGVGQTVEYQFLAFGETFSKPVLLPQKIEPTQQAEDRLQISAPMKSGSYRLRVQLTPAGSGPPTQDEAELGVYHPVNSLPKPEIKTNSDVEITGMLGLKCLRLALDLPRFFPSREKSPVGDSAFDWKPFDEQIQPFALELKRVGIKGFVLLNARPDWCNETNFAALIRQIAARYRNVQKTWEIENEPNGRYSPESYVKLALAPAYRGAHAADPDCMILGPSIVRVDLRWFERFFKAGGADSLDAVSTHTYTGHNRSWEEHGNAEHLRGLRKLMAQYGAKNKAIWITETGFTWDNHAEMPRLHGEYCVRMMALASAVGIVPEHFYYFYTRYAGFQPWYLYDNAPNYSGMALRSFFEQTSGKRFSREIELGRHAHGVVFTDKTGSMETALLWTDDFKASARFRLSASPLSLKDLLGNPVSVRRDKAGIVTLLLSGSPLFLTFPKETKLTALTQFGFGTDIAQKEHGSIGEVSSAASPAEAGNINDGTWHFDDGQSDQKIWTAKKGEPLPQWASVTFDKPQKIGSIFVTSPSSNVGLPGIRDFSIQVMTDNGWKTVREVKGNVVEWTLFARFIPVKTQAVRVLISDLNNGWWFQDKTPFTDFQARVYELECYAE